VSWRLPYQRRDLHYVLRDYIYNSARRPAYIHLDHDPGFGKSHIMNYQLEKTDALFISLYPSHRLGEEMIEKMPFESEYVQIESRSRLCQVEDLKKLAKKGVNIKPFCEECPRITMCDYYIRIWEIMDETQPWIGVHHHIGGLANSYADERNIDIIVIDEAFINAIRKHNRFGHPLILSTYHLLEKMENCAEKELLLQYLQAFLFAFQSKGVINVEHLTWCARDYMRRGIERAPDLLRFAADYELLLAELFFRKRTLFRNIVTPLCQAIINVRKRDTRGNHPDRYDYINSVFQTRMGRTKLIDMMYFDTDALDFGCKLAILDATTPTDFYRKIFKREIHSVGVGLAVNSTIYQVTSAKYVMQTLDQSETALRKLHKMVDLIAKKHPDGVLVLSRKKYEHAIKAINPRVIHTDHYPIRGSNDYKHLNAVVIFGTPEPSFNTVERSATLLGCSEEEIKLIMRETEIIQGVHRIRPTLKTDTPTYVYLLTKLPLPFDNIKKLKASRLIALLQGESGLYVTEDTEDRIREDIFHKLEEGDIQLTKLVESISGNRNVVREIVRRMKEAHAIDFYKGEKEGRGRKPLMVKLT